MKHLLLASALMMAIPGLAQADNPGKHGREMARDHRHAERDYDKDRRKAEREYFKDRRKAEREYQRDLARAERRWARGEYLPRSYLADTYYVRDYGAYGLEAPPPGYTWVRPDPRDDQYYMVQLATGLIQQILGP
jgi:Ni/Co efflux regulator RcnB